MFKHIIDQDTELALPCMGDAEELFELIDHNRDHLRVWLPWVDGSAEVANTEVFIKIARQEFASGDSVTSVIRYRGKIAGLVSLMSIQPGNRKAEIGYWLAKEYEGKGIMTSATNAVINHAFDDLSLNRLEIRCGEGNDRSRAIPKRLGFREEGCLKDSEWLYDHFISHVVYGMTVSDWKNRS